MSGIGALHESYRSEGTWPVGVLYSRSGITAIAEISQLQGTLLAISEINDAGGVLGKPISPLILDPASDPQRYTQLASSLLMDRGVTNIFGCSASYSRKAVVPVVEHRGGLLWYSIGYEGFEYSSNVIYTGPAPNQLHLPLAEYLFPRYGRKLMCVGTDYLFPRESNRIMRDLLSEIGGSIVGEYYLPFGAQRDAFLDAIKEARLLGADVIFSTVVGPGIAALYDAYAVEKLDPAVMPIASLTTNEAHLQEMWFEPRPGHIVSAPYFETVQSPRNNSFVANYHQRFGAKRPADACAEAAYFTVLLFARALERAGTLDPEWLRAQVLGLEVSAPQGVVMVDPDNSHTYLWPRIGKTVAGRKFEVVAEFKKSMKPDPYLVNYVGLGRIDRDHGQEEMDNVR
ncbi:MULTISPECIES: transporter substrate-binding domain-containing protein [Aminobacter]|uniref:transporter substrate-binding domain-containing protein n=1 Tax=Aminobacter TaxID=31988 RepID=UPI0006FEC6A2|nr:MULTISPECIES: transporter substrate-binding domain-containing protein [Aminobacter]AWC22482.1 Aliphatic amidase expression-regulating protein [Aminobacter sp. MSH1]KQU64989.1 amino acid ABC transporter substrate-binding protein [Aminobacter sp. DSM 101952]MDR7225146.1 branched-chain amino acid transport system substrate-binding protein [Aminobacter aminovorans]WMC96064.1 transporter substrate-binding domain-containing protein [Aminobacter aminovorans]